LYSARYGLEGLVARRIIDFVALRLGIPLEEAQVIHRDLLHNYGTTLEWLITEKGFTDTDSYYAAIHPEEEADSLPPDPELREYLTGLPVPKAILTNSPREHADRILDKLGIGDLFTHVFDIRFNSFKGKPRPEAFRRALEALDGAPDTVLFVDDYPEYIQGYLSLGGKALLLDESDAYPDYPYDRIQNLRELDRFLTD
jgi:putative hydrolase of the HAD superfamily